MRLRDFVLGLIATIVWRGRLARDGPPRGRLRSSRARIRTTYVCS